ncbi:GAF and ANTAR domain-containing protein [Williamsia sp. MIQD14]|uniref:GAF and ANTAR domain-containing protein n=1 Tax=Williamsia sp. MIQD14 TaxID=3425703 RepID=UPI003DA190B4
MNNTHDNPPENNHVRHALFGGIAQLCEIVVRLTEVDGAAMAFFGSGGVVRELVYASDVISQQLDDLQFTLGEGPCIDSFVQRRVHLFDDIDAGRDGERWPVFTAEAIALGARAVFAIPVGDSGTPLGVLELYRRRPGGLTETQLASATMCAEAAAVTIRRNWDVYAADTEHGDGAPAPVFEPGEFSRERVYLASGMVAVQLSVSPDEALGRLRALAYKQGRPVKDVAEDIVSRAITFRDDENDEDRNDEQNEGRR